MEKREIREGLLRAERARKQLIRPKLQELGLTPGQGQVGILNRLLQRPNISQRELADLCYLRREKNPDCRRSYQVCLTPAGEKKAQEVRAVLGQMDEIICEGISAQEHEEFLRILRKICDNMEREEKS